MRKVYYWYSEKDACARKIRLTKELRRSWLNSEGEFFTPPSNVVHIPTGYIDAIDLISGQRFKYTIQSEGEILKTAESDTKCSGTFDPDNVVFLSYRSGRPALYTIGQGGIENRELTLEKASRLQEICDQLNISIPIVRGFGDRSSPSLRAMVPATSG